MDFEAGQNKNFVFAMNKQLEYEYNDDIKINVDDRILNFCKKAEENFIRNSNQVKEIEKLNRIDSRIKEEKTKVVAEEIKSQNYKSRGVVGQDPNYNSSLRGNMALSREGAFQNFEFSMGRNTAKSNELDPQRRAYSSIRRSLESKETNSTLGMKGMRETKGLKSNSNMSQSNYYPPKRQTQNVISRSDKFDNQWGSNTDFYNSNGMNTVKNRGEFQESYNLRLSATNSNYKGNQSQYQYQYNPDQFSSYKFSNQNTTDHAKTKMNGLSHSGVHNSSKTQHHCIACELKKKIENKPDTQHINHIKFKYNFDLNNAVLEAKINMKNSNYKKAYEILKLPIIQGVMHSDIFYLYSEVCRIMRIYDDSEKYLLETLKFEKHSPYIYYTGGLLYQELKEYKKSVSLFKHFLEVIENGDTHYQIAKSYTGLKNYLKASLHISNAIEINPDSAEYYYFRSKIYQILGFHELAKDDLVVIRQLQHN